VKDSTQVGRREPIGGVRAMMQEVDEMLLDKVDDRLPLVGPSNQMGVESRPS
jgi:hypothetical protein